MDVPEQILAELVVCLEEALQSGSRRYSRRAELALEDYKNYRATHA